MQGAKARQKIKLMKFVLLNSDVLFELESGEDQNGKNGYSSHCNGNQHHPSKDLFSKIEQKLDHKSFKSIDEIKSILNDFGFMDSNDFIILDSNEFYHKWNAMEFANEDHYLFLTFVEE